MLPDFAAEAAQKSICKSRIPPAFEENVHLSLKRRMKQVTRTDPGRDAGLCVICASPRGRSGCVDGFAALHDVSDSSPCAGRICAGIPSNVVFPLDNHRQNRYNNTQIAHRFSIFKGHDGTKTRVSTLREPASGASRRRARGITHS